MFKLLNQAKKVVTVIVLLLGLSIFLPASSVLAAQPTDLEFTNLDLQIWPEYDDPRVLAIYSGTLKNVSGQSFSGNISFNIPKNIEVKMACEIVNGGQHSCQPYDMEDKGDYQVLSWKTTKPIPPGGEYPLWLEYYYSPLTGSPDKSMELIHTPFYKTQNLNLTIKQPLDSSNYLAKPEASFKQQDSEGFTNHNYTFQNIDSEKPVRVNISYTRSKTKPSVEPIKEDGSQGGGSDPLGTSAWKKPEVIVPVALFTIALIGFIFYSLVYSKNQPPINRVRRLQSKHENGSASKSNSKSGGNKERKRIRQLLLDGKISEETYRKLIEELD